jgi:ABC-type transporter Mla MlaB component
METTSSAQASNGQQPYSPAIAEAIRLHLEAEKKISTNIMSIRLSPDGLIFKDTQSAHSNTTITEPLSYQYTTDRLSGVYCQGVQYFDLSSVQFINNSGMATLIDLLKSLLEMGVEVQFVNVDEKIKSKIREAGLDKIINCSSRN